MRTVFLIVFLGLTGFLTLGTASLTWAQDHEHDDHGHGHSHSHEAPPDLQKENATTLEAAGRTIKKKSKFPGYGRYNRAIANFCGKLDMDGHAERFYDWVTVLAETKNPKCRPCQILFKTFYLNCRRELKIEARRKAKPTPKHTVEASEEEKVNSEEEKRPVVRPQLEPHLQVIDSAMRLFTAMEQDDAIVDESMPAINEFIALLRQKEGHTREEQEYFSLLADYIEAVFVGHTAKPLEEEQDKSPNSEPEVQLNLDELF